MTIHFVHEALILKIHISECIDMVKLNGAFQFVAGESESDCAIFFIGDVDEIVSLTITELNMRDSCNQQDEYVKVGWNKLRFYRVFQNCTNACLHSTLDFDIS